MNKKTREAKIYDPDNDEFLSDVTVEVGLVTPSNPNEKPQYEVISRKADMSVELSDKNLILEFNPKLRGYALFTISKIMGGIPEFKIYLQDSVWWNLEWFENL